jgi:hypothetical protein
MPTPRQHAKRSLKALRAFITTLTEANAENVTLSFSVEDVAESPRIDDFTLSTLGSLRMIPPNLVGVRAAQSTFLDVAASEPEDAI